MTYDKDNIRKQEIQFSLVAQLCPTLCNPKDCSTLGLFVHHPLLEFTQTHVHWIGRWCHPTISSSVVPFSSHPQSFPVSGFFRWVSSSHEVAKVLEFQLQHQSFHWTFRTYLLWDGLVGSPCSPRDSHKSSPTPQFKIIRSTENSGIKIRQNVVQKF